MPQRARSTNAAQLEPNPLQITHRRIHKQVARSESWWGLQKPIHAWSLLNSDLHPTRRPFTSQDPRNQPGARSAGCPPEQQPQRIARELAAFARAWHWKGNGSNADALASQSDSSQQHGAGGVMGIGGDPHLDHRGLIAQPLREGGDLGGGVETLQQFWPRQRCRRTQWTSDHQTLGRFGQPGRDALAGSQAGGAAIKHHHQINAIGGWWR